MKNLLTEEDLKFSCHYCHHVAGEDWKSEFYNHTHYKTTNCPGCGVKNSITVDFEGSGHDDWSGKNNWKNDLKNNDPLQDVVEEEYRLVEEGVDRLQELLNR